MANKRNNWHELLEMANKDAIRHDRRIDIHEDDEGYFSIVITAPSDGQRFPFAENLFEHELGECINDAWAHTRKYNMNLQKLLQTEADCRIILEKTILQFVREYGDDATDREINEFGLDEEREGDITKLWNFFDNGGCCFNVDDNINSEKLNDIDGKNWHDRLCEGMTHTAYQCLYIVVDKEGAEHLKYYRFYNGGVAFDEVNAEPDHDHVSKLPLVDLSYIIEAIRTFLWKSNDQDKGLSINY